jgi:hypothetical protein
MNTPRQRDDFNVWALAEAEIARKAMGLDARAIDWKAVVTIARGQREQGVPETQLDWRKIIAQASNEAVKSTASARTKNAPKS